MIHFAQLPLVRKSKKGTLPNLIVIGARKCGTTSLHYYLGLHPQISMSRKKELDFFIREGNWHRGIEWYRSNFAGEVRIYGESSPNYTDYPFFDGVPERMYSVVPEAELIYILRDPIDRIISDYVHQYAARRENRDIADVLSNLETNHYVCRSRYFMQLEQYLKYYPRSRILIITQEELLQRRRETLKEVFRFLNVDDSFHSLRFFIVKHRTRDKRRVNRTGYLLKQMHGMNALRRLSPDIHWHFERWLCFPFSQRIERPGLDERLRQALIDHLRDDVDRLREYTGRDFEDWCL